MHRPSRADTLFARQPTDALRRCRPLFCEFEQRITRIADTLQRTLEEGFVESVRANDTERLTQCLRTYALIDKARQAEALYRQTVVAPFVAKVGNCAGVGSASFSPRL